MAKSTGAAFGSVTRSIENSISPGSPGLFFGTLPGGLRSFLPRLS